MATPNRRLHSSSRGLVDELRKPSSTAARPSTGLPRTRAWPSPSSIASCAASGASRWKRPPNSASTSACILRRSGRDGARPGIGEGHGRGLGRVTKRAIRFSWAGPAARSLRGRHLQGSTYRCRGRRSWTMQAGVHGSRTDPVMAAMPLLAEARPGSARLTRSPARPRTPRPARDGASRPR